MTPDRFASWLLSCGALTAYRRLVYRRSLVTVLCLHRVAPTSDELAPALPPHLLRFLCRFAKQHYRVVRFCDLPKEARRVGPRPLLVLSFDDAYADFFERAMPILLEEGLRANLNVITGCADSAEPYLWQTCVDFLAAAATPDLARALEALGVSFAAASRRAIGLEFTRWFQEQRPPVLEVLAARIQELRRSKDFALSRMMDWDQVREAHRLGFEIGSHTASHSSLDTLSLEAVEHELALSKTRLEGELAHPIEVLAFPGGRHTADVVQLGKRLGYRYFLAIGDSLNPLSTPIWDRILVYGDSEARLAVRASGLESTLRSKAGVRALAGLLIGRTDGTAARHPD